jgi:hypothetical protein
MIHALLIVLILYPIFWVPTRILYAYLTKGEK